MLIKMIVDEDFVQYKEPCMYIGTSFCDGKCCKDAGVPMSDCINDEWRGIATIDLPIDEIIQRYISNDITKSICFAGLEPFEQFDDVLLFVSKLRYDYRCQDTVVIYTGYYPHEIEQCITELKKFKNIIIKFGRYIPNRSKRFDDVLGVWLASDNQYALQIGDDTSGNSTKSR